MLSPSDFNNAVPQFTNGNYASNPINPQYVAEPDAENYNRGTEPLQTLPAQWWNWFINKFTARFNKVNIYVKNIFNELAQVLSIFNITPDGTEQTPTTSQLKTVFESCYPQYVKNDLYGNIAGTALGTAAVGTATTFARSDHVHPIPATVPYAQETNCVRLENGYALLCFMNSVGASPAVIGFNITSNILYTYNRFEFYNTITMKDNAVIIGNLTGTASNATALEGYDLCAYGCNATVALRTNNGDLCANNFIGNLTGTASNATTLGGYSLERISCPNSVVLRDNYCNIYANCFVGNLIGTAQAANYAESTNNVKTSQTGYALLNFLKGDGTIGQSLGYQEEKNILYTYSPFNFFGAVSFMGPVSAITFQGNLAGTATCATNACHADTATCVTWYSLNTDTTKPVYLFENNSCVCIKSDGVLFLGSVTLNEWNTIWRFGKRSLKIDSLGFGEPWIYYIPLDGNISNN